MITPMDIHNKTFSKGLRGYSEEEVNDFLRQIVTDSSRSIVSIARWKKKWTR